MKGSECVIMEKYEFEVDNLGYSEIETLILDYYNLGYANSSNFMKLETGVHNDYYIFATKGTIEFSTIVGKNNSGKYSITISPKKNK